MTGLPTRRRSPIPVQTRRVNSLIENNALPLSQAKFLYMCLGLAFSVFWFSLDYFVLVLFAFVVLRLVSSILRQEIGWEERLQNDLFCVE